MVNASSRSRSRAWYEMPHIRLPLSISKGLIKDKAGPLLIRAFSPHGVFPADRTCRIAETCDMVLLIPAYARSYLGYPAAGCELITITIEHGIVPPDKHSALRREYI